MIKTDKRYSDGSIAYIHNCKYCNNNTYINVKSKTEGRCKKCLHLFRVENGKKNPIAIKHGMRYHPFYNKWKTMKQRCYNPNNPRYADWGGRGIIVCNEWKNDAKAFIEYISLLNNAGKDGYSIDRINNNGNYEPSNIKWSTKQEQNNNQRHKKTNTGEPRITKEQIGNYIRFRINNKNKRINFKTLDEALIYRKDLFGF